MDVRPGRQGGGGGGGREGTQFTAGLHYNVIKQHYITHEHMILHAHKMVSCETIYKILGTVHVSVHAYATIFHSCNK